MTPTSLTLSSASQLTPAWLAQQLPPCTGTIWVALSGGQDSSVLLHLARMLREQGMIASLKALHVHHGLQVEADAWSDTLTALCADWAVPLVIERVKLEGLTENLEAQARAARYRVFEQYVGKDDLLLMAHHQRDQAETLLYRLCRGAGPRGLAAMPARRPLGLGQLVRPLLGVPKRVLEQYADLHQVPWIDDPSNRSVRFDRNFLRLQVLPELRARWPHVEAQLAQASALCAEEQAELREYAYAQMAAWPQSSAPLLAGLKALHWPSLAEQSVARQKLLLRTWLVDTGCTLPSQRQLIECLAGLLTTRCDADPHFVLSTGVLRRYRAFIYFVPHWAPLDRTVSLPITQERTDLPANGTLQLQPLNWLGFSLEVGYRSEALLSERFALRGRVGRKSFKKWCQQAGVPPWLRGRLPLLFSKGELVALAGIGVLEHAPIDSAHQHLRCDWCPPWQAH